VIHALHLLVDHFQIASPQALWLLALVKMVTLVHHQIADQSALSMQIVRVTWLACNRSVETLVQDHVEQEPLAELSATSQFVLVTPVTVVIHMLDVLSLNH